MIPLSRAIPVAAACFCASGLFAQAVSNSGTVKGTVSDPSAAVVRGAMVRLENPVSGFTETTATDAAGAFEITNIPYNNYHLTATAEGFQTWTRDLDVRSPIPLELKIDLHLGAANSTVSIEAGADLVE